MGGPAGAFLFTLERWSTGPWLQMRTALFNSPKTYHGAVGRGCGVGRGLGVTLGVALGVGVTVGVPVGVGVGVGPSAVVLRIAPKPPTAFPVLVSVKETL
ncbi:MAG: hypothetical protein DME78_06420 [Verrucomicrobia bacterium]|nr:MAG: hypothetical protein DME78_06420 [Verrucomicrobiota bacterium]